MDRMKRSILTKLVLLGGICFAIALLSTPSNAQGLESPCPKIFAYETPITAPNKWYGIVKLWDFDLDGIWLRIVLDRPVAQLGVYNWFGQVKTTDQQTFLVKNKTYKVIPNTLTHIRFYITYNSSEPTPQLKSLILNGKTICPEDQTTPPPIGELYTKKELNKSDNSDNDDEFLSGGFAVFRPTDDNSNVECGIIPNQANPLITYGKKTKPGQFPWHAALYHSKDGSLSYKCGGSLISKHHIITAAHCVSKPVSPALLDPEALLIYLGKYYLNRWSNPGMQTHPVSTIMRHPQYNSANYANDIAVMKLLLPVEFTNFVRPICLWEGDTDISNVVGKSGEMSYPVIIINSYIRVFETTGTVVGWGYDEKDKLSEELTILNIPIVPKDVCIYSLPDFYSKFTTPDSYCAGFSNGTSVCNGDSGGGMVFQKTGEQPDRKAFHLRGLVSLSVTLKDKAKCDPSHYVVFTDVAKYLEFIKKAMMK
ncbi:modular serine protease [Holotrichia oblita]|uniref:Modular serine protease n=1 Tax=Holotrichia oblita TaxID=644536 RepID=A0ACB9SKH9_HOLOL|nr:modular serine protease [Holotrichia oblita]